MFNVRIQFTSPKKIFPIFAWSVQAFEGTRYSHVRLIWTNRAGDEVVFEASGTSVKLLGKESFRFHPIKVHSEFSVNLSPGQWDKLISFLKYSGISYGVWQIIGIAIARLLRLKKNPLSDGKYTMVCSEIVARFLIEVLGLDFKDDLDTVGPKGVFTFLKNHPEIFQHTVN